VSDEISVPIPGRPGRFRSNVHVLEISRRRHRIVAGVTMAPLASGSRDSLIGALPRGVGTGRRSTGCAALHLSTGACGFLLEPRGAQPPPPPLPQTEL